MNQRNQNRQLMQLRSPDTIEEVIVGSQSRMEKMSKGREIDVERISVLARMACQKNPKLLECTRSSMFWACLEAVQCNLNWDGEEGALVPFWNGRLKCNEVRFMPMYKGLVRQLYATGVCEAVDAVCVYEGEHFVCERGTSPKIEHHQRFDIARTNDRIVNVYVVFFLTGGGVKFEALGRDDIERVRGVSKTKDSRGGPWDTWWDRMALKTVIKRGITLLPRRPGVITDILEVDNRLEIGDEALTVSMARSGGVEVPGRAIPPKGQTAKNSEDGAGDMDLPEDPSNAPPDEPAAPQGDSEASAPAQSPEPKAPAEGESQSQEVRPQGDEECAAYLHFIAGHSDPDSLFRTAEKRAKEAGFTKLHLALIEHASAIEEHILEGSDDYPKDESLDAEIAALKARFPLGGE